MSLLQSVTMNFLLFLLYVSSLALQANIGFSQYYVKPTEPVNSSCPGQPCLTLSQYITGQYFISKHNSVFTFMSGVHAISLSVTISNSSDVTFESCLGCDGMVTVVYNSSSYCVSCSAFVLYNATNIVYKGINITVQADIISLVQVFNGIFVSGGTNITFDGVSIVITDIHDNYNHTRDLCSNCFAVFLVSTVDVRLVHFTFNVGKLYIRDSINIFAKSISVGSTSYGELVTYNTKNTTICHSSIFGGMQVEYTENIELVNIKWKIERKLTTAFILSSKITFQNIEIQQITKSDVINYYSIFTIFASEVFIQDTFFTGFSSVLKHVQRIASEAIISAQDCILHLQNCTFSNNSILSIIALGSDQRTDIIFSGFVIFLNNTAYLGPCLNLYGKSYITVADNSYVLFSNNHALSVGGCIHAALPQESCIFQLAESATLRFHNNSASIGGDVLYVFGDLSYSNTYCLNTFEHHSEIYPNDSLSIISSDPTRVCVCDTTGHPDCLKVLLNFTVYPGQTISLTAVIVGQTFGTSTGSIYAQFLNKNNVTLDQYQYIQIAKHTQCNQLRYTIFSPPIENNVLSLTITEQSRVYIVTNETVEKAVYSYNDFYDVNSDIFYFPVQINITVQPCPIGFTLSQPPHKCICCPILSNLGAKCYLQTLSFERSGMSWIGFESETVMVSKECRFFLCKESETNVTVTDPNAQCNFNHSGTLCGSCQGNLSLALGSQQCFHCSNQYLALLVPFAVAGIVLVLAIKTLDITVATGYVNGLVLYFNTIHTVWFVLQNPQNRNPILAAIVAWINLDLGIETCFFDGLTPYWKTWLQFLFPLYLWAISGAMILLAKYSRRMTKMMGSNPVSVLATIFLLSYTKLLRNCASVMFYSTVVYPNTTKIVWAVDGSIEYLGHQHLPLFIVALCVILFLCLPYTLLLVLGQWLYKIENRIVSRVMFRIKPIMDAYFGPLKDKHRYWAGMLLLSRAIIEISISIVPNPSIENILLSTSILAVFLSLMAGYAKGFYNNQFVTVFEVTLLLNLAVFSLTKIYTQSNAQLIVDDAFTAAGIAQLFSLIIYRFVVLFKPMYRGHCGVDPLSKCFKRGQTEGDDNWNKFEEAIVMRENPAPEHEDVEEPASLDSLPTY